jgi:prepilin-type N-terminal cleavage/methylation domain-containing protein
MIAALRRRLGRNERGYTLIEMLTVMVIMGVVMGALTAVFVSAFKSETDMNKRFQAQVGSRLALDRIRRDVHCGKAQAASSPVGTAAWSVTLTLGSYCRALRPLPSPLPSYCTINGDGTTTCSVTWCTRNVSTNRYALYRVLSATCGSTGGVKWADYLVPTSTAASCATPSALCIFTALAPTGSKSKLHADFPVNLKPANSRDLYELADDIVLLNSPRS